jgi:hypothetical protein
MADSTVEATPGNVVRAASVVVALRMCGNVV